MKVLFDTSIFVDHLRGLEASRNVIRRVWMGELQGHISSLTEAELFSGKECEKESKREQILSLISLFAKRNVDNDICQRAGQYRRKYGVVLADCIIAATASLLEAILFTKNVREFQLIKEIKVEDPY